MNIRGILFQIFCFVTVHCSIKKTDLILKFLNEDEKFSICFFCWADVENVYFLNSTYVKKATRIAFFSIQEKNISQMNVRLDDKINFILDLGCPNVFNLLEEKYFEDKFTNLYSWLLIYNSTESILDFSNEFWAKKLRFDTRLKAIDFETQSSGRIFEIYNPGHEASVKIILIASFLNENINYFEISENFYESRKELKGVVLRTGNTNNFSFDTEEDFAKEIRTKGEKTFEKFNFQLFLCLMSIHQFKYITILRNAYFGNTTSGIDSGIAQLVHEKRVDMSTSGGFIRVDRIDYYDFLVPVYKFRTCFIFVNPGKTKPGTEVLKPFSANTWYLLMLTGLLMGVTVKIAYWVECAFDKNTPKYSLFTSMVIIISVFAQQGSAIVPFRVAGRILFLNLLIFSMIIYNYYTSSLVSSLLSSVPDPISTVRELYESNLKVAIEPRPYTITYIIQQRNDRYISLLNSTKIYEDGVPNYLSPNEGIAKVKQGTYAYHTDDVTAYSWLDNAEQELICDLAQINFLPEGDIGIVMQKNSEYTELFQISLRKMQTSGIYRREILVWVPKKPACLLSTRLKAVGLNELFLVYLTFGSGLLVSILIFCLEIISKRLNFE